MKNGLYVSNQGKYRFSGFNFNPRTISWTKLVLSIYFSHSSWEGRTEYKEAFMELQEINWEQIIRKRREENRLIIAVQIF